MSWAVMIKAPARRAGAKPYFPARFSAGSGVIHQDQRTGRARQGEPWGIRSMSCTKLLLWETEGPTYLSHRGRREEGPLKSESKTVMLYSSKENFLCSDCTLYCKLHKVW